MANEMDRRGLIRAGSALLPAAGAAAVLAGALAPARAEAAATSRANHPVVGTWSTLVTVEGSGAGAEPGMFAFGADGLMSGNDASGVTGFGTWEATGPTTYSLAFWHYVIANGTIVGTVQITMTGTVTSATEFTEQGEAKLVDSSGAVLLTHEASATGTRFGFGPWNLGAAHR